MHGRFHGDEAEHLAEVRRDHVPEAPRGLVERAAPCGRQLLRHVDLYRHQIVAVPRRFDQSVGEPQRQDVLHRFLSQEVVDPVHLILADDVLQCGVEFAGGFEVGAERLLHDDAGVLGQPFAAEHADHRLRGLRRNREVDQRAGVLTEAFVRLLDRGREILAVVGIGDLKAHAPQQVVEHLLVDVVDEFLQLAADLVAELVIGARRVAARSDDGVVLGQASCSRQVVQTGEELALGQIASRTE